MDPLAVEVRVATFDQNFLLRLEKEIVDFEAGTSVEFVPVFLDQCSDYRRLRLLWALGFFVIYMTFVWFLPRWWVPWEVYTLGVLLSWALFMLSGLGAVFRRLFPKRSYLLDVEAQAKEIFVVEELFETQQRSALLVLVSQFEQAVYVLADKGLCEKLGTRAWSDLAAALAKDFSAALPGESFFLALEALKLQMAKHFPPAADNQNELSNRLRRRTDLMKKSISFSTKNLTKKLN